jgi:hypothetical protein
MFGVSPNILGRDQPDGDPPEAAPGSIREALFNHFQGWIYFCDVTQGSPVSGKNDSNGVDGLWRHFQQFIG